MSLRVIGGEHRGRILRSVRGMTTRPLLGQVREALFNILTGKVEGAECWDLFAGTGATGIEALSRGAARVSFVEKSPQALSVLRKNLEMLGPEVEARSRVLRADARDLPPLLLDGAEGEVAPDLIFLDPPYALVAEDPVRAAWRAHKLVERLAPGGVLCFHFQVGHLDRDDFDAGLDVDLREWGSSALALVRRAHQPPLPEPT